MTRHPDRLAAVRRAGRALARLGAALVAVRLGAEVVGTWITAGATAAAMTVGAVRWWARVVEGQLLASRPPARAPAQLVPPAVTTQDARERRVAFAQALATVAARYMADCQAERQP